LTDFAPREIGLDLICVGAGSANLPALSTIASGPAGLPVAGAHTSHRVPRPEGNL